MIFTMAIMSVVAFIIIQLPPGDYLTSYIMQLQTSGQTVDAAQIEMLRRQYGLDLPLHEQYLLWISKIVRGNFGISFDYNRPVLELLAQRIPITVLISSLTLLVTYVIAIPIGVYSAVRQYSIVDYVGTVISFIGLATPNFLIALILMYACQRLFGFNASGLFFPEYANAPWSLAKFIDMLKHLPIPVIVIGLSGTASVMRVMRASLLDELKLEYVEAARAKGLKELALLLRYPVRVALNPIVSTIGWVLPGILSGATVTAIVLDLPTVGALMYRALLSQDMYVAATCVMFLTFLTVIGTFLSDLLLMWVDPRIRYE